jgi:PAS domain S-box-containing protein
MDGQGLVVEWSAAAEATFGWPARNALGRKVSELIIPERFRSAHEAGLARFISGGQGTMLDRPLKIDAVHRDGHEFPITVRIGGEKSADGYRFPTWIESA